MTIVIRIDHPDRDAQGLKEALAMDLEKYGSGVRVVEVKAEDPKQESFWRKRS